MWLLFIFEALSTVKKGKKRTFVSGDLWVVCESEMKTWILQNIVNIVNSAYVQQPVESSVGLWLGDSDAHKTVRIKRSVRTWKFFFFQEIQLKGFRYFQICVYCVKYVRKIMACAAKRLGDLSYLWPNALHNKYQYVVHSVFFNDRTSQF